MSRPTTKRARAHGERGFILALGLLMLAALALIGTMALSTASFQNDLANNVKVSQETYYAATYGLSAALRDMIREKPIRSSMTLEHSDLYMVGAFNRRTGLSSASAGACNLDQLNVACLCADILPRSDCIYYYVEAELLNVGNAPPRWGIGEYFTWYYKMSATATNYQGSSRKAAVFVAGVYPGAYR